MEFKAGKDPSQQVKVFDQKKRLFWKKGFLEEEKNNQGVFSQKDRWWFFLGGLFWTKIEVNIRQQNQQELLEGYCWGG